MSPHQAVDCAVRLAERELREGDVAGLPEILTPDGVARLALAFLTVPYAEAAAIAERSRALVESLGTGASPWEQGEVLDSQPDEDLEKAGEVNVLISPLESLVTHIHDKKLAAEVRRWLDVVNYLG
jgi:hypothetical protein